MMTFTNKLLHTSKGHMATTSRDTVHVAYLGGKWYVHDWFLSKQEPMTDALTPKAKCRLGQ
jgi:poly-beta-hydroxyalkanoate depolymerase